VASDEGLIEAVAAGCQYLSRWTVRAERGTPWGEEGRREALPRASVAPAKNIPLGALAHEELVQHHSTGGEVVRMEVRGLSWMGVRVADLPAAAAFFERLGLEHERTEDDMAVFKAKNGDTVEVFGHGDTDHRHFDTGPVVGFEVDDIEAARRELEAAGARFIGATGRGGGMAWAHFRGPEGFVYELTARE